MRKIISILIIMFSVSVLYSVDNIGTTLVIIEETENGVISPEKSPFSDGIYDALWDKCTSIFFDVRIKNEIPVLSGNLNAEPYIDTAKKNGADSIILIKLNYTSREKGNNLEINIEEVVYNFYSLNKFAILKSGKKSINYSKTILKTNKEGILKK